VLLEEVVQVRIGIRLEQITDVDEKVENYSDPLFVGRERR